MKKNYLKIALLIIIIIIGFLLMIVFSIIIFKQGYINNAGVDIDKIGSLGFFIGGLIAALWSLAGFFLIFQVLRDQNEIIRRRYLYDSEDLNFAKETSRNKVSLLEIQNFEQTFFVLLDHLIGFRNNIRYKNADEILYGKMYFDFLYNEFIELSIFEICSSHIELKESDYNTIKGTMTNDSIKELYTSYWPFYKNKNVEESLIEQLKENEYLDDEYFVQIFSLV